jgi:hypothetical protein
MLDNMGGGIGRLPNEATRRPMAAFIDALPELPPLPEAPLNARSETRFQDPRGPVFEFQLDAQGKVTGAILEQGAQRIPLERK